MQKKASSPYVVGLTGGIASGKTQVSDRLGQCGATIVDTDVIAREVVAPGSPALAEIAAVFGASALLEDGSLNRAHLRSAVFADTNLRRRLEAITHPRIREQALAAVQAATGPYVVLVVPLLIESALLGAVDRVLVVDTSPELQLERLLARDGSSEETAKAMIKAQTDRATRLAAADDILKNESSLAALMISVDELHQNYLQLAAAASRD